MPSALLSPCGVAGREVGDDGGEGDLVQQASLAEHAQRDVLHEGVNAHNDVRLVAIQALPHLPGLTREQAHTRTHAHTHARSNTHAHTHTPPTHTHTCVSRGRGFVDDTRWYGEDRIMKMNEWSTCKNKHAELIGGGFTMG